MQYSGKIVTTADYGTTYGITDTDGIIDFLFNSIVQIFLPCFRWLSDKHAMAWLSSWKSTWLKLVIRMDSWLCKSTFLVTTSSWQ